MSAEQKAELDAAYDSAVKQTLESTADGKILVSHSQDVSGILEANKRQRHPRDAGSADRGYGNQDEVRAGHARVFNA